MDKSLVLPYINIDYSFNFVNINIKKYNIKKCNINDILLSTVHNLKNNNKIKQIHYNDVIHSQR